MSKLGTNIFLISTTSNYIRSNVTLLVEMKDKEFTSHKAKYALQFGTNNNMIGLSLTFKSIKQKIQFSQHSELISFLMFWKVFYILISTESHAAEKKDFHTKKLIHEGWGAHVKIWRMIFSQNFIILFKFKSISTLQML